MPKEVFPKPYDIAGPHIEIHKKEGNTLLPDPPIGQVDPEEIMDADPAALGELLAQYSKRIAGRSLSVEELFEPDATFTVENGNAHLWTKSNCIRATILFLDGQSNSEIASALNMLPLSRSSDALTTGNSVAVVMGRVLQEPIKQWGVQASHVRILHTYLHPEDPDLERMVAALQAKATAAYQKREGSQAGVFPRGRLFSQKILTRVAEPQHRRQEQLKEVISRPEYAIQVIFQRYCKGLTGERLRNFASNLIGRELTDNDVSMLLTKNRIVTSEAKELFGDVRDSTQASPVHWTTEEFEQVASLMISSPSIRRKDIAAHVGRKETMLIGAIAREMKSLALSEKYKGCSGIVAFFLEYGKLTGTDKERRARAEALARDYREKDSIRSRNAALEAWARRKGAKS